jgi:uncharacterized OsmC-like protein
MSVKVSQIEGMKLKAEYDGLEVISGRIDENSAPEGLSPGKLMAASLGMCTGMHVLWYLKRKGIEHSGFEISVDTINEKNSSSCVEFNTNVNLKAELTEEQKEGLMAEANRCYVGNTLKGTPAINLRLELD